MPMGPVRRATLATTDGFAIYEGTEHPDEAWELLKFLVSADYGRAMVEANFLQPARASLVDEWIEVVRAQFPEKARGLDLEAFADGHTKGYSVTTEVFANMAEAEQIAYEAWDEIFTYGHSSIDLMKDACSSIQEAQRR